MLTKYMKIPILLFFLFFIISLNTSYAIDVWIPDTTGISPGQSIQIPIYTEDVIGQNVFSYYTNVLFDSEVLVCTGISTIGTISSSWPSPVYNTGISGEVNIAGFGIYPLVGDGEIIYMNFTVIGALHDFTSITFDYFEYNEGTPSVSLTNGNLYIGTPPVIPTNLIVQNTIIDNGQIECYNATDTINIAGSGTTVDLLSGGETTFIAGEKIVFNPGFKAYEGSYCSAYITTTDDYCSSQQSMITVDYDTIQEATDYVSISNKLSNINIYPNPTSGSLVIDFMGKKTTAEIFLSNFQGKQVVSTRCNDQLKKSIDIGYQPGGMYIIAIKTQTSIIIRKIIKN